MEKNRCKVSRSAIRAIDRGLGISGSLFLFLDSSSTVFFNPGQSLTSSGLIPNFFIKSFRPAIIIVSTVQGTAYCTPLYRHILFIPSLIDDLILILSGTRSRYLRCIKVLAQLVPRWTISGTSDRKSVV